MSATLLEVTVALFLVWIAWRIGKLLTPWILHRTGLGARFFPRRNEAAGQKKLLHFESKPPEK